MLSLAVRNTQKLIREKSKSDNIRLGRLFTKKETARLMANMLTLDPSRAVYTLLDPGAGTGILSSAVIEKICKECPDAKQIYITAYESCADFYEMLCDNLERIRKKCRHDFGVKLFITTYNENYLTESKNHYTVSFFDEVIEDKFDIVIMNPPTELCEKDSEEALAVGGVTQLKISKAYLFTSLAIRHIEEGGQMVAALPTEMATADAAAPLRREIAERVSLNRIHLFIGKQKNQSRAIPLKKTMLLGYKRDAEASEIKISTSYDEGAEITMLPPLPYGFIVDKNDGSLTLPKSVEDSKIVKYITAFPETLDSLGLKMSTGLVIDSKCEGLLFTEPIPTAVPLLRPSSIKNGQIAFPQPVKRQYIAPVNPRLIQKNKNILIVKRVPAKSDERFVNTAIYLAAQLPQYRFISTHNKVNFIDTKDKSQEICPRLLFGLFALLNSTIYDRFISIISKSKQINSKEMKSLPLPPRNIIENIGMRLMAARRTSVAACDQIVNPTLHIIVK